MPTLHVRKSGSDANTYAQAQSPATAWLTIDKAANEVVAGDTVYVGAGVYRETVTMAGLGPLYPNTDGTAVSLEYSTGTEAFSLINSDPDTAPSTTTWVSSLYNTATAELWMAL